LKKWESSIKAFSFNFKTTGDFNEVLKKTQTLKKERKKERKSSLSSVLGPCPSSYLVAHKMTTVL